MIAKPTIALIHSPLVGPLTWQTVGRLLEAHGFSTATPSLLGVFDAEPPFYPRLARQAAEAIRVADGEGTVVLVGHSGAGALLPPIAAEVGPCVAGAIFVDAGLPHSGVSWFADAPDELARQIRGLAREGRLPPWDTWFPPEAIEELLPDAELRAAFHADLPRLPLSYFEEPAPTVTLAPKIRGGYLLLSDGYQAAAEEAERHGWPLIHLPSDHLAMLTQPESVAAALEQLIDAITA